MTESFARLVDPFVQETLQYLEGFSEPASRHPGLVEVHNRLVSLLEEARQAAVSLPRPREYLELAESALVYWADEVLIRSRWMHASVWRRDGLLEQALYHDNVGGDEFFTKAERARAESRDALETFFLCVTLGFRGRHGVKGSDGVVGPRADAWLIDWIDKSYALIYQPIAPFLPPDPPDPAPGTLPGRALLLQSSVLTMITVLATLAAVIAAAHFG